MYTLTYCKKIAEKFFLLSVVLFQFTDVKAQNRYGIMVGAGKTSLNKIAYSTEDKSRYSPTTSYWGGLSADFALGNSGFSLFTSVIYNKRGYKYSLQNQTGAYNTVKDSAYSQDLNYIDLNITVRKKFALGERTAFFIGTGPSINIFMSGKEQTSVNYFGNTNPAVERTKTDLVVGNAAGAYKRIFLGLGSVAGFEFNKFSIWFSYNLPLDFYYQDKNKKLQHKLSTFGLNAGYALFSGKRTEREKKEKPAIPVEIAKDTLTDSDGDGIPDFKDKCPGHKGVVKYGGCPVPDTDGDGINDELDRCPLVAGSLANGGCPEFKEPVVQVSKDTMHFIVYFEPGKSELKTEGYNALNEVIRLLKANPRLVAQFNGHTDNVGSVEANSIRAFSRASVCADYVASFFVDRHRLVVAAYSNRMPAADLKDPTMQWKNRRVEIYVYEKSD